jgi:uncharacterized protein (DUF488 family)
MEIFAGLLLRHGIEVVADVRTNPYSRFNPQFNRETLQANLERHGINYRFMGDTLGARTDDPRCLVDGVMQYDLLAKTETFRAGLAEVAEMAAGRRVALMCAEKEPLACHRTILICRHLAQTGIAIKHIHGDGRLEDHESTEARLVEEMGLVSGDLFMTGEELIQEAYDRKGRRIAYRKKET